MSITTAVFPVAGMGTRFLPVTKAGPKEMLPIVDKPVIQYAVEEAVASGIKHIVFITSNGKRAIEDYFDKNFELENHLENKDNQHLLSVVKNILPPDVSVTYIRQSNPKGLGHAVLCAKHVVGNKPFAVLLPDDIIHSAAKSCLKQLIEIHEVTKSSVLAVEKVPLEDVSKYGIVSVSQSKNYPVINNIVEKPKKEDAPSQLAVTGRYILSPKIFDYLETTQKGAGGEIQLTDAIAKLINDENMVAHPFVGKRYDCGNPLGLLKATITFALQRPELSSEVRSFLEEVIPESITS